MYDNDILQQIIDTATALQSANDTKAATADALVDAKAADAAAEDEVASLNAELDRLTGKTTTVPSRVRR